MGFLQGVSVYLSGPIEAASNPNSWRDQLTPKLESLGLVVWDPLVKPSWMVDVDGQGQRRMKDVLRNGGDSSSIERKNSEIRRVGRALAYACNIMIVGIRREFTVGTWEEVTIASQCGKPVFFLADDPIPSMWLVDMFDAYDLEGIFFQSQDDLVKYLIGINNHNVHIDRVKWIFKTYKETNDV